MIKLRLAHLCYGHKSSTGTVRRLFHQKSYDSTASVRCPAGGRKNRTIFYHFLDIVRCLVNFRYYLKFHGARTAFGRVIKGKIARCPDGARPAFAHIGRAPDEFCLIFISYDSNGARPGTVRCPAGHRTMSKNMIKNRTILPAAGRAPYGRSRIVRFLVK